MHPSLEEEMRDGTRLMRAALKEGRKVLPDCLPVGDGSEMATSKRTFAGCVRMAAIRNTSNDLDKQRAPIERNTPSPTLVAWWQMNLKVLQLFVIAMVSSAVQASDVNMGRKVTGTYEFIICKGACSFSDRGNAFATAVVVLFDGVISRKDRVRIGPNYRYGPR